MKFDNKALTPVQRKQSGRVGKGQAVGKGAGMPPEMMMGGGSPPIPPMGGPPPMTPPPPPADMSEFKPPKPKKKPKPAGPPMAKGGPGKAFPSKTFPKKKAGAFSKPGDKRAMKGLKGKM